MKTMLRHTGQRILLASIAAGCIVLSTLAQEAPTTADADGQREPSDNLRWPRVFKEPNLVLTVYQPQIESWQGNHLEARAAVGATGADESNSVFGAVWLSARTEVDKAARLVTLEESQVTKVSFPTALQREPEFLAALRRHLPGGTRTISLDHLEADFAVAQAVKQSMAVEVRNNPPRILFSKVPAVLALIDGPPVLRPLQGQPVERVINTRALLLRVNGSFYLSAAGYWYQAAEVEGPWSALASVPVGLDSVKQSLAASGQVDLMQPEDNTPVFASPPALYVSTAPAELLQSRGEPQMLPVAGTQLLDVKNSDNPIFLNLTDNNYYVLVSGRWFHAQSLSSTWAFVPGKSLPLDFARIPLDHSRANILASVPGTPQAQEAVIANSIPQTASVKRNEAGLTVSYDGPAQFAPIAGTPLQYAVNTAVPVLRVDGKTFYSVQNGIWFVATSPNGPWAAATSVPAVIYTIPPSSPLHYVTYVRIYGYTPELVYCGYTPGYFGTVVSPDYVVVYGTGYAYRPWCGTFWVGSPCTYGFRAGFECGWDVGFGLGFAAGPVWCSPWWGVWGRHEAWHHRDVRVNLVNVNIYNRWDHHIVAAPQRAVLRGGVERGIVHPFSPYSGSREAVTAATLHRELPLPHGNIYAGHGGQVFRQNESRAWEQHTPSGWRPISPAGPSQGQLPELNRNSYSRALGELRSGRSQNPSRFHEHVAR